MAGDGPSGVLWMARQTVKVCGSPVLRFATRLKLVTIRMGVAVFVAILIGSDGGRRHRHRG
ncbi:hypothetical protein WBK31_34375 [Nonomuraea sp. N2-4H]|uniref:hypothetical protein n=1 Tax=unclassified Nonomuraea TaxID=2593643 RepID=UPI003254697A